MHGVDAELRHRRHQHRYRDQDGRRRLEEAANEKQQQVDQQQEHPRRVREAQHPRGDHVGDARRGQEPAEDRRGGDDEQHRSRGLDGFHRHLDQHLERQRAVPEEAEEQRPDGRGDGTFGRREDARRHPTDQEHRRHDREHRLELPFPVGAEQQQHRHAGRGRRVGAQQHRAPDHQRERDDDGKLQCRLANPAPQELDVGAPVVLVREIGDGQHHQHGHHQTRQDPGQEQLPDRDVRHHPVDHERQRRRDDRPERRRRGGHANREFLGVPVVAHRLDLDRAEARRVGDRRSGHASEDHGPDDVHVTEPALHPADQRQREVVDPVRDAGVVHQVAGEDEERHGEQREAVEAADHPVDDHHRRRASRQPDVDQRCARHRDGDRNAGHHQREERGEERPRHAKRGRRAAPRPRGPLGGRRAQRVSGGAFTCGRRAAPRPRGPLGGDARSAFRGGVHSIVSSIACSGCSRRLHPRRQFSMATCTDRTVAAANPNAQMP